MKKKAILFVLAALAVIVGGYFMYTLSDKKTPEYTVSFILPEEIDFVISLNNSAMEGFITEAFLSNPTEASKKYDSLKTSTFLKWATHQPKDGLYKTKATPYLILKSDSSVELYLLKKVVDSSDLNAALSPYLQKNYFKIVQTDSSRSTFYSDSLNSFITTNGEWLLSAYAPNTALNNFLTIWSKCTAKQPAPTVKVTNILNLLSNSTEPISILITSTYFKKKLPELGALPFVFSTLKFSKGQLLVEAQTLSMLDSTLLDLIQPTPFRTIGIDTALVSTTISFFISDKSRLATFSKKTDSYLHSYQLSTKELLTKWNGNFRFDYYGTKTIQEKSITYEYDDNFNKIEKIGSIQKKQHNLRFFLGDSSSALLKYLVAQGFLKKEERIYKAVHFPFQELYAINDSLGIQFQPDKKPYPMRTISNSAQELMTGWYKKGTKGTEVPFLNAYPTIDRFDWVIRKTSDREIRLRANIAFSDKEKNGLFQLVELFRK